MKKKTPKAAFRKLAAIYTRMADGYADAAQAIGLSCEGCTDNCCYSFFQHHTYIEWAYLWEGLKQLPDAQRTLFEDRSREYVEQARQDLQRGERPHIMCPLNLGDEGQGRCGLYEHRLMICRMHGVPNVMTRPDGRSVDFPGCWKCQELTGDMREQDRQPPVVDRTPLYSDLARLEMEFVGPKLRSLPKVDHTIAEMIVLGPPALR
ncbi:hypothetical protein [Pseudodesulfovibrio senegalensis]|jgi:Fe-S-cluster containining protein|uniref:YkgJ family cysteine cluster protein n=1 Tax=Pseudodesulfovibrio senegalensis TaxID=1721087 RepID=A0A6N6N429_9BACT|nr:hypothetical protein [Pseudodesulfovibrio senegalensis]KAB1442804.1 hypothetical protein F8A88_00570 [Pseudodesulfovibrio senegalensis]